MHPNLFPTPEAAAMERSPAAYCRVLAVAVDGDDGFVMLDTGPRECRYLYGGSVKRLAGGWCGLSDSNGGGTGWTRTDPDHDLGVVHICNEAPADADIVCVSWRGELRFAALIMAIAAIVVGVERVRAHGSTTARAVMAGFLVEAASIAFGALIGGVGALLVRGMRRLYLARKRRELRA